MAKIDLRALEALSSTVLPRFGDALRESGFDESFVGTTERLAPNQFDPVRLPLVHYHLRAMDAPAAVVARVFAYDDPVSEAELTSVLGGDVTDALSDAKVLTEAEEKNHLASALRLMPFFGTYVLSDPFDAVDPVMGPGATTAELARILPPKLTGKCLDVGAGSGSLALVMKARGAERVVAVDLDGRALEFTKINAALNRLPIDGDEGDLLAPVEGQRFDLVVSQPPFVIRPPGIGQTTFLHGGPRGEELALRLFAGLPSVLRPGGAALVRFDAPAADTPVLRRVLTALATDRSEESVRDLRVALLSARGASADLQAIGYAAAQHPALDAAYREDVFRYRDHLAKMNIERTLHCFLRLEVPADSGGYAVSRAVPTLGAYGHEAVVEWVSALELASLPPNRLEAAPIAPAPDLQLSDERSLRPSVPKSSTGESPQPEGGRLLVRRPGNLIDAQELSDAGAVLLEALHQSGTLGGAIAQFAERVGAAPDEVRGDLQGFVRQLLVAGVLVAGNSNSDPNGA